MTNTEEQQITHAISGIAQGINALLALLKESGLQSAKADEEMSASIEHSSASQMKDNRFIDSYPRIAICSS